MCYAKFSKCIKTTPESTDKSVNRLEPLTLEPLNTRSGRCGVRVPLKPKHLTFCLFSWKWIFSRSPGRNTSLSRWQPETGSLRPRQSVRQCLRTRERSTLHSLTVTYARHSQLSHRCQPLPAHILITFVSLTSSEHSLRSRIKFWYFAQLNCLSLVFQCLSFDIPSSAKKIWIFGQGICVDDIPIVNKLK